MQKKNGKIILNIAWNLQHIDWKPAFRETRFSSRNESSVAVAIAWKANNNGHDFDIFINTEKSESEAAFTWACWSVRSSCLQTQQPNANAGFKWLCSSNPRSTEGAFFYLLASAIIYLLENIDSKTVQRGETCEILKINTYTHTYIHTDGQSSSLDVAKVCRQNRPALARGLKETEHPAAAFQQLR